MGFSYGYNCCQLQRIGKLIKEKLFKGIFRVDLFIKVAANTQHYILSVNKGPIRVMAFRVFFFFSKIMLEN